MLFLIVGPSGYGKTHNIISEIKKISESKNKKKTFVIVPEQESVRMEAELLEYCGNSINSFVEVLNFSRLANRVFREAGGMTYEYCDNSKKDLITAVLLEKLKPALPIFSKTVDDTDFIKQLRSEMDSYRLRGLHASDFDSVREKLIEKDKGGRSFDLKLQDFSMMFSAYENALKESTTDATDDVVRLSKTLEEYDFFEDTNVYIDGFYDYTSPQYDVIEQIIKSANNTTITFSLSESDPEEIFRRTKKAFDKVRTDAEKHFIEYEIEYLKENRRTQNESLKQLAESFITGESPKLPNTDALSVVQCQTAFDECVFVAREIVKLVKNGVKYKEIAVTAASVSTYGTMLERVFESYGINYLACTSKSVMETTVASFVFSSLDTVSSGFRVNDVRMLLKSVYLGLTEEESFALENYLLLWNVRKKQWMSDSDWKMHPRGYVEHFEKRDEAELELVNTARRKVFKFLSLLYGGFSDMSSVGEKCKSLIEYFSSLNMFEKITDFSSELREKGRGDAADNEISAWNSILSAIEVIYKGASDIKVGRDRFVKYLKLILSDMSFGKIPSSIDEVEIGDIEFVRNKNIKHLFFIGFNEGVFPAFEKPRSLFTESERNWLLENEVEISDADDDMLLDQNFLFLLALLRPSETITFVYHSGDSKNSKVSILPSFFLSSITDYMDVEVKNFSSDGVVPVSRHELRRAILSNELSDSTLDIIDSKDSKFYEETKNMSSAVEGAMSPYELKESNKLFGDTLSMTQSRIEKYERCKFSYFLECMLKLRPRKRAAIDRAEIGNYVHKILETVLRRIVDEGKDVASVTEMEIEEHTLCASKEYILKVTPDIDIDSPRYAFLLENIMSFVILVIENIRDEFSASLFRPKLFEESLADSAEVSPYEVTFKDGTKMKLYGVIDRVDTFVDENGTEYVRVVDYKSKTGGKTFSLQDVINGMNLQMLIYLFAFLKTPKPYKRVAAGIMYMPTVKSESGASDRLPSDEDARRAISSSLKRRGMYLNDNALIDAMDGGEEKSFIGVKYKDGEYLSTSYSTLIKLEELGIIERYVNSLFDEVMTDLKSGRIEASPLCSENGSSPCEWCPYHPICRFDGEVRERKKVDSPLEFMKDALGE